VIARDSALEEANPILDARSGEPYTFDERGYVPFTRAATVICLRRRPGGPRPRALHREELVVDRDGTRGTLDEMIGASGSYTISGEWQVLLGQAQVVNYVKSRSISEVCSMRYPGELKLPGGVQDPEDSTLLDTARRELAEEFLIDAPLESIVLRPLSATQTRRIAGRSNLMMNFLAFTDENPWLGALDVLAVTDELHRREVRAEALLGGGSWATMSDAERRRLAPEMHRLVWADFADAIPTLQASIGRELLPVDDWQRAQFQRFGIQRRDPMSVTMITLLGAERRATALRAEPPSVVNYEAMILAESRRFSLNIERLGRRRDSLRGKL